MQMKRKIGYRLAHIFLVLLGVSFLSFLLMYVSPGDPVRAMYAVSGSIPEVLPKSWTKVMRQSHFEFCIGQDLTHSIFL